MKTPCPLFHVDGERGLRGGERQLLYLAAALRARGHRNVIYCRAGSELETEARRQGFPTRALTFFSLATLPSAARREGAVIHAHTARAAGFGALASLAGIPFVAHRRVDFGVKTLGAWKYSRAAKVVAVSEAVARILEGSGLAAARVAVVPDALPATPAECSWAGVDPRRYAPPSAEEKAAQRRLHAQEFGVDASASWVGNLAALVPHKDHDTLLAAAVIVLLRRPNTRFLIAGQGPEEERLLERIHRMGLDGKVLLVGQRVDPVPLLKSLDVYVQSSWGEGMGSVLIEAAACGVPIAATSAGGIPEVVENAVTGLLTAPRDPEALAASVLRLLEDRTLARRLADEGLRRLPRFGLTAMADAMEKIYAPLA